MRNLRRAEDRAQQAALEAQQHYINALTAARKRAELDVHMLARRLLEIGLT